MYYYSFFIVRKVNCLLTLLAVHIANCKNPTLNNMTLACMTCNQPNEQEQGGITGRVSGVPGHYVTHLNDTAMLCIFVMHSYKHLLNAALTTVCPCFGHILYSDTCISMVRARKHTCILPTLPWPLSNLCQTAPIRIEYINRFSHLSYNLLNSNYISDRFN